jgi:hypothetical protein
MCVVKFKHLLPICKIGHCISVITLKWLKLFSKSYQLLLEIKKIPSAQNDKLLYKKVATITLYTLEQ